MGGPLRGFWLRRIFAAMPRQLDPARAHGVQAVIDYRIRGRRDGGHDRWQAVIADGRCVTTPDGDRPPDVSLAVDPVPFLKLVSGHATGPELFMTGKLSVDGDLSLAAQLPTLFRIPSVDRRRPRG